jgi:uncharacterized protein (DUF433 family)
VEGGATMDTSRLIERYIEPDPYRPGPGEARLKEYGVPVWALVGHMNAVDGQIERVAEDYDLPEEAVHAALAYYRQYRAAIDARLRANAASFA